MYKMLIGLLLYDDLSMSRKKNPESATILSMMAIHVKDQNKPTLPLINSNKPNIAGNKIIVSAIGYTAPHKISKMEASLLREYVEYIVGIKNTRLARAA